MQIEIDLRTGPDEPSGIRWKDIAVFAQGVFIEEQTDGIVFRVFNKIGREMMNDLVAAGIRGFALHGHDVHVFLEPGIDKDIDDVVRTVRREDVRLLHRHDEIGLADVPLIEIVELAGCRHVGWISHGRAGIHPFTDRRDLGFAQ